MATGQLGCLVRCFSTSSFARAKLVKPPLAVFGTEGRYANALYSAASKEGKLDVVEGEMKAIQRMVRKEPNFNDFVLDPTRNRQAKKESILAVLKRLNMCQLTLNFCETLIDNGRLGRLDATVSTFSRIMSAHRGEVLCEITTAKPLDAAMKAELDAVLNSFLKSGDKLITEMKVDPTIIGGMIVSIGDKYADMSMATKIKNYTTLLKAPV